MRKGTTPTFTLEVEDLDLSTAKTIWLVLKQHNTIIKKTQDDLTVNENTIACELSQEETLSFSMNYNLELQLRVLTNYDKAYASKIFSVPVNKLLIDEVIE